MSGPMEMEQVGCASTAGPSKLASNNAAHPVRDMRWSFKAMSLRVKFRAVVAQVLLLAALFVHDAVNTRLIP